MKKTFVLMVAKEFLQGHPKAGQPTSFDEFILAEFKIHTIRGNYDYWKRIIDQVNAGKAVLSIRQWKDKPYRSKQEEILQLEKAGIQKIEWNNYLGWFVDDIDTDIATATIARNDGLSVQDFKDWFKGYPVGEWAIIHFTDFRYAIDAD